MAHGQTSHLHAGRLSSSIASATLIIDVWRILPISTQVINEIVMPSVIALPAGPSSSTSASLRRIKTA